MEDHVEFNEPKVSTDNIVNEDKSSFEGKMVGFVRSLLGGLVKSDKQASYVVFVVVSIFLLVALYYLLQSFSNTPGTEEVLRAVHA